MAARRVLLLATILLAAPLLAGCAQPSTTSAGTTSTTTSTTPRATAPPLADYGDAPGSFPTTFASGGAYAVDVTQARLGKNATTEADAVFPDADDGLVQLVMLLTQIPPPATLTVQASAPPGSQGGMFYLNVVIDLTLDGQWGGKAAGAPEWVVQNQEVKLKAGETLDVETAPFAFSNGLILPDGAWMRIALTKEHIKTSDWDGKGEFTAGEIEDHVIRIPEVDGKKPAIPVMSCPREVDFGGAATAVVDCTVWNIAPAGHGTDIHWSLTRLDGGVVIAVTEGDVSVAPGDPAGVKVTFTATKGEPLPSTWRYTAVGIDPPSLVTADGVDVGYGVSDGTVEFMEAAAACVVLISIIETGKQHYSGESDAIFWVQLIIQMREGEAQKSAAGAKVTGTTDSGTVTSTADAEGRAELRQRVYSYGQYPITVTGVELDGCTWDKAKSRTTATADVS